MTNEDEITYNMHKIPWCRQGLQKLKGEKYHFEFCCMGKLHKGKII